MHHGYYLDNPNKDHLQAQIDLIEEALKFAKVTTPPKTIVDVGCGIGGSSRYLARKYGSKVTGINLSPVHVDRATKLSAQQGLSDKCQFVVGDALKMPFADNSFDLVYSMESGEHMPNVGDNWRDVLEEREREKKKIECLYVKNQILSNRKKNLLRNVCVF